MASEPKLTEVKISASSGGKVSQIKFDLSFDTHMSAARTYTIPEDMTNEQAEQWQMEQLAALYNEVDGVVDPVIQGFMASSALFDDDGEYLG